MTDNLVERYEGVRALGNADPDEIGVGRPAGLDLLRRHYEALPDSKPGNVKVGLTSAGYAVYRNTTNGRLGYFRIVLRGPDGEPTLGGYSYRPKSANARVYVPTNPHDGFGEEWYNRPDQDSRPSVQEQYGT